MPKGIKGFQKGHPNYSGYRFPKGNIPWNCNPIDKNWLIQKYCKEKMSMNRIAKIIKRNVTDVKRWLQKYGIKIRNWSEARRIFTPGKFIDKHGYIYLFKPEHSRAIGNGYIAEHRLAMEQELGRYLLPREVVHHIDGDPANNEIENLQIMSRSEHSKLHYLQ